MLIKTRERALYVHVHLLIKPHVNLRSICKCLKMRSMDCTITFSPSGPWPGVPSWKLSETTQPCTLSQKAAFGIESAFAFFFQDGSISLVGWASRLTVVCFNGFFAFLGDVMKMTSWDF